MYALVDIDMCPRIGMVARDDYVAGESGRLVNRLFGGRISPLVAQLASQDQLTAEDIAELEDILKGLKS